MIVTDGTDKNAGAFAMFYALPEQSPGAGGIIRLSGAGCRREITLVPSTGAVQVNSDGTYAVLFFLTAVTGCGGCVRLVKPGRGEIEGSRVTLRDSQRTSGGGIVRLKKGDRVALCLSGGDGASVREASLLMIRL